MNPNDVLDAKWLEKFNEVLSGPRVKPSEPKGPQPRTKELSTPRKISLATTPKMVWEEDLDLFNDCTTYFNQAIYFYFKVNKQNYPARKMHMTARAVANAARMLLDLEISPEKWAYWCMHWFWCKCPRAPERINQIYAKTKINRTVAYYTGDWKKPICDYLIHPKDALLIKEQFYRNTEAQQIWAQGKNCLEGGSYSDEYLVKRKLELETGVCDPLTNWPKGGC